MGAINNLFPGQRIGEQTVDNIEYLGATNGGNARAGVVGEFQTAELASGSAVSLTSGTTANVVSLNLTAGDWDVWGLVGLHPSASTVIDNATSGVSTTSATLDGLGSYESDVYQVTSAIDLMKSSGHVRLSLSATTTVYLVTDVTFTASTCTAYGVLNARRVR